MTSETEVFYFLITFDHALGAMVDEPHRFDDPEEASQAYEAAERDRAHQRPEIEVLLVASDSLETVARTHGVFFGDTVDALRAKLSVI